jgi:hypothetical protein
MGGEVSNLFAAADQFAHYCKSWIEVPVSGKAEIEDTPHAIGRGSHATVLNRVPGVLGVVPVPKSPWVNAD